MHACESDITWDPESVEDAEDAWLLSSNPRHDIAEALGLASREIALGHWRRAFRAGYEAAKIAG